MRLAALFFFVLLGPAEIIDRIAVSVEKRVITESEILRQMRVTAFLNHEQPEITPVNKRAMADKLVEQLFIRRELETSRYPTAPPDISANYKAIRGKYGSDEEYNQALAKARITDADVQEALQWQATLLDFVEQRFRPGIQIPASEIREYYDLQAALNPGKLPPFEEAKDEIETILTSQRVDNALDRWLGQSRTQSQVRYREEVFQ